MRKQIGPNVREDVVIAAVENSACRYVHLGLLQRLQLFALLRTAWNLQHILYRYKSILTTRLTITFVLA